jgi:hypothetical protein
MIIEPKIYHAKGYFCQCCKTYHESPYYHLVIETVRDYGKRTTTIKNRIALCPACKTNYLEKVNIFDWVELKTYANFHKIPLEFVFPVYEKGELTNTAKTYREDVIDTVAKLSNKSVMILDFEETEEGGFAVIIDFV